MSAIPYALSLAFFPWAQQPLPSALGHEPAIQAVRVPVEFSSARPASYGLNRAQDLDGDGDVDVLMYERPHPSAVQSWLNDGRGSFHLAHRLQLELPPGDPSGFEVARRTELSDVNGDGVPDLLYSRLDVFGQVGGSGVLVHLGLGDGSFGPSELIASQGGVADFAVGDADGDGDGDVLIEDYGGIAWWLSQGGAFVRGTVLVLGPDVLWDLTLLDLDHDGLIDLVANPYDRIDRLRLFRTTAGALVELPELLFPADFTSAYRPNV